MAQLNPTVIAAHLDDEKLRASIQKLVTDIQNSTKQIKDAFDTSINHVEQRLKNLGNTKVNLGGIGNSQLENSQKRVTQSVKETTVAFDQMTTAMQKAKGHKSIMEDYNIQIEILKDRLNTVKSQLLSFQQIARVGGETGDKGLYIFAAQNINKYNEEIKRLEQTITELESKKKSLQNIMTPQGHTIENFVKSLTKTNPELERLNQQYKQGTALLQQQETKIVQITQKTQQQTNEQDRLNRKIQRQAEIIRERLDKSGSISAQWGNAVIYDPAVHRQHLSIEEQLLQLHKESEQAIQRRIAQQQKESQVKQQAINETQQQAEAENRVTQQVERRTQKKMTFSTYDDLRQAVAHVLQVQTNEVQMANTATASYNRLQASLKQLQQAYYRLTAAERNSEQGAALAASMRELEREIQKINKMRSRPSSLKEILGFDEHTIDDLRYKISQLQNYKSGINITDKQQKKEIQDVDTEINRLSRDLKKYENTSRSALEHNNALTRSWNYMKNRLAFYLTVGATQSFVKQLIDVRGQYEMLERSIGILVDSARQGTKIFSELNAMAIKSPFTTMELGAAAKQLTAYDVAAKDVVDTTRRLADMAAAVGIPIERLTYALGQIKAYGYLNARDARMFSNAGIPLVKELADHYTTLEGRMVSTADVYDRIKKKAIGYNDVMSVVNRMTDQGGKFFNFQEKVADTLRVRIANLTLAWNNMLNEMGRDNQGLLTGMLTGTKKLMEHWRDIYNTLLGIGVAFLAYKAALLIYLGLIRKANAEFIKQKVLGQKLTNIWSGISAKMVTGTNFAFAGFTALALVVSKLIWDFVDLQRANEQLNKSIVDGSKENIESINKFFEEYSSHISSIGSYSLAEQVKVWERIQDEIEKTSANAEGYIGVLENISSIPERVEKGAEILDQIENINKVVQSMADKELFDLGGGFMGDNMLEDLNDFEKSYNAVLKKYGDLEKLEEKGRESDTWTKEKKDLAGFLVQLDEAKNELQDFGNILDKANISRIFGQGDNEQQLANLRNYTNAVRDYYLATEDGQKVTASGQALLNSYIDEWVAKKAQQKGILDEDSMQIEQNRTAWEIFFQQLNHDDKETMDILRENHLEGSEEFKKIWDKAAKSMQESSSYSYELIKKQIAELRNTPDVVLRVIYRVSTVDADDPHARQRQSFVDKYIKPNYVPTVKNFKNWQAELKQRNQKYGRFNIADNEDNVEYEKRLGQQYQNNAASIKSLNNQLAHGTKLTEASRKAKEEELKTLQEEQKTLEEIRGSEGFDYDQFAKGGKGKGTGKKKGSGKGTKPEDEVAKALKDELSIIKEMQSNYTKLRKVGVDATTALRISSSGYEGTLSRINAILTKFGVAQFNAKDFVGKDAADPNTLLNALKKQRETLIKSGKVKIASLKDLDVEIQKLTVDAKTYNLQKITDGLNREFEKLHNDYELSVELDANPELGDMFADMFNIDRSKLPHNMADLIKDAQKIANEAISKYNDESQGMREGQRANPAKFLDIMRGDIQQWAKDAGVDIESELFVKLKNEQDKLRDQYKNYMLETEKDLDDYVKKYGITADRIAEIEAERLRKLNNLNNEYYNEELRKLPEYQTKLDAINKGAAKEKDKVWFDDFKSSELYAQMFDRIEDVSTATLELLRGKVKQVKESLDELDPTQVKELTQQFAKIDEELIRRNPFKGLVKNYKEYISALKNQKQVEQDYLDAQKNYDAQMEVVAALEEQLKQKEYQEPLDSEGINSLKQQVTAARNLLKILKQILGIKEEDNEENKEAISKFQKQAQSLANDLQEISKIVGTIGSITEALGVDEDTNEIISDIAQSIEGVSEMAQGMAQMSTNPIAGVSGIIGGLWKTVSGWFDNANKRIDRKIKKQQLQVTRLTNFYKKLEDAANHAYGAEAYGAQKAMIANKEFQLEALKAQLRLEKSRKKKYQDKEKIAELEGQIIDLKNEINEATENIVNDLLGISTKGDFAEQLVKDMIDAFKQGEDYMKVFEDSFEDMIDNMIMKAIVSRLVGDWINSIWDRVNAKVEQSDRAASAKKQLEEATKKYQEFDELVNESPTSANIQLRDFWKRKYEEALKAYNEAITPTPDDIASMRGFFEQGRENFKNNFLAYMDAFGIQFGQSKKGANLSALQQGIQSITEDTAGALEAITSGMSQQVYYQSTLLEQIRDSVIGLDLDVSLGVQSQILLQLQNSYQTQQAIQHILEGVLVPSGRAFAVELLS